MTADNATTMIKHDNVITLPTDDATTLLREAAAIRSCLDYLQLETKKLGLDLTSFLISVAAESIDDQITSGNMNRPVPLDRQSSAR